MFYDPRMGSAITLTGQFIIQHVANHSSKRFNDFFKTDGIKYNKYSDTDSIFFTLQNIVEKYWKNQSNLKIVDALDKLIETKLRPFIDEATDHIAAVQNHRVKTIFFKRENICSGGFWVGKKRYALKVYDSEGVRIPEGEYKIMGIEVVRSSTPLIVRDKLKKCIEHIIDKDLEGTRKLATELRKEFDTLPPEVIAFPRSANNLSKYSHPSTIYAKGAPIAVRGSLLFNHYLNKYNLQETQNPINEGDKIKFIYLKEPNTIRENVIAFIDKLPEEFKLDKYIDRQTQYDKTFMAPLENIFEAIGWEIEEKADLDEFFN